MIHSELIFHIIQGICQSSFVFFLNLEFLSSQDHLRYYPLFTVFVFVPFNNTIDLYVLCIKLHMYGCISRIFFFSIDLFVHLGASTTHLQSYPFTLAL